MTGFLCTAGRWGGIFTIIALIIALLTQLIKFFSFLMAVIKFGIVIAFIGLVLMIVLMMLKGRRDRRREEL